MYRDVIDEYVNNIEAIRLFVEYVEPVLLTRQKENIQNSTETLIPLVLALSKADSMKGHLKRLEENVEKRLWAQYGHLVNELVIDNEGKISFNINSEREGSSMFHALEQLILDAKQIYILYTGAFISSISYFEFLISQILYIHIMKYTSIINSKQISFEQISQHSTIDDIKKYMVEHEIDKIMRPGFDEWMLYIRNNLKLEIVSKIKDEVNELFCRRNVLVHNNGLVDSNYLYKVKEEYRNSISIGDKLEVNKQYIFDALDMLLINGIKILYAVWVNDESHSTIRLGYFNELGNRYLWLKNWKCLYSICGALIDDKENGSESCNISRINLWLCCKRLGKIDSVREQIRDAIENCNKKILLLCMYALIDQADDFFSLLSTMTTTEIATEDLKVWPVFDELRQDERFTEYLSRR